MPCGVSFAPEALIAAYTASPSTFTSSRKNKSNIVEEDVEEVEDTHGGNSASDNGSTAKSKVGGASEKPMNHKGEQLLPSGLTLAQASKALDLPHALLHCEAIRTKALTFTRALQSLSASDRNVLGRCSALQPVPASVLVGAPSATAGVSHLKAWISKRRLEDRVQSLKGGSSSLPVATATTTRHTTARDVLANSMQTGFTLKKVRVVSRRGGVREEEQPWGPDYRGTDQQPLLLHPLCYRCKVSLSSPSHMARLATTPRGMRDGVRHAFLIQ